MKKPLWVYGPTGRRKKGTEAEQKVPLSASEGGKTGFNGTIFSSIS
jgi:hypothetical protein